MELIKLSVTVFPGFSGLGKGCHQHLEWLLDRIRRFKLCIRFSLVCSSLCALPIMKLAFALFSPFVSTFFDIFFDADVFTTPLNKYVHGVESDL